MAIGDRRNIRDDEAPNLFGMQKRQSHRRLAPHGMPDNIGLAAERADHLGQIRSQVGIFMTIRPRALAMIAHIHADHLPRFRHPFGNHIPVSGRAKKPMRNEDRGQITGIAEMRDRKHSPF